MVRSGLYPLKAYNIARSQPLAPSREAGSCMRRKAANRRDADHGPCMDGSPLARVYLSILQLLVGAAMYPTCRCGLSYAAGHNAIRAAQVPIESSHSKCTAQLGSPDPAVSTGFVHQLLFALSNLVGDPRALSRSMR